MVAQERAFMQAQTVRLFNIDIAGSDTNHELDLSWAGKYDKIGGYENANGNTVVTFDGHAVFSSADSLYFTADVTNNSASL